MFTSNFNESNALVEGFYLVLLAAMAIVAALSVLFALGSIVCAVMDCATKVKQPAFRRTKSIKQMVAVKAAR